MAERVAGVVVRRGDRLSFIPADAAVRIVQRPEITRVPGAEIGMALIAGRVVAVIELDKRKGELLLCELEGETIALSGLQVRSAGFFDVADGGDGAVVLDGERVARLNVAGELAHVERNLWSGREHS
jgi:hypothetical protein